VLYKHVFNVYAGQVVVKQGLVLTVNSCRRPAAISTRCGFMAHNLCEVNCTGILLTMSLRHVLITQSVPGARRVKKECENGKQR
jgi:hypothetical protein